MESDPHDARIGKIPHWVREAMFIVVSVALGFALAQFGEERADRRLAAHALTNLRAELEYNQAVLEPMVPIHAKWVEALANADTSDRSQSGIDVFFATRPTLPADVPSPFPFLRRSAWDAALSGGALRLIDYDVLATLSEIYRTQEIDTENVDRLAKGALSSAATFDPASRAASVRLLWLTLADIQAAEQMLLAALKPVVLLSITPRPKTSTCYCRVGMVIPGHSAAPGCGASRCVVHRCYLPLKV